MRNPPEGMGIFTHTRLARQTCDFSLLQNSHIIQIYYPSAKYCRTLINSETVYLDVLTDGQTLGRQYWKIISSVEFVFVYISCKQYKKEPVCGCRQSGLSSRSSREHWAWQYREGLFQVDNGGQPTGQPTTGTGDALSRGRHLRQGNQTHVWDVF